MNVRYFLISASFPFLCATTIAMVSDDEKQQGGPHSTQNVSLQKKSDEAETQGPRDSAMITKLRELEAADIEKAINLSRDDHEKELLEKAISLSLENQTILKMNLQCGPLLMLENLREQCDKMKEEHNRLKIVIQTIQQEIKRLEQRSQNSTAEEDEGDRTLKRLKDELKQLIQERDELVDMKITPLMLKIEELQEPMEEPQSTSIFTNDDTDDEE